MSIDTSEYWFFEYFDILDSLSDSEKQKVMNLSCRTNWKKKSIIYNDKEKADKLFFVKSGTVKISKYSKEGKEIIISIHKKGEVFGEASAFNDSNTYNEVSETLNDVLTCELSIVHVRELLRTNLEFNKSFLKMIGKRKERIQKRLELLFFKSAPDRIKGFIKDYALEYGSKLKYSNEIEVKLSLTHEDISKLLGTTRQTVTSEFNLLQKNEVIVYDRSRILVKNIDLL